MSATPSHPANTNLRVMFILTKTIARLMFVSKDYPNSMNTGLSTAFYESLVANDEETPS
ncbi:hypothetical protein QVN42_15590 [Yersinia nurmii]|uniref:Uncharacterized protein n=1 Tax=Yersinia nurmii TaxID=685706 RepID=A0AAW7K9G5_9GAMM|nr:hypothetical protein [Yersinia nurmii]MDN0088779.1 hypothetical protein [Yersinia nurmii]